MNQINLEKPDYFPLCSYNTYKVLLTCNFDIYNHQTFLIPPQPPCVIRIKTLDSMLQEATDHSCRDKVAAILPTLLLVACATIIVANTIIFFAPNIAIMYTVLYIAGALYISLSTLESRKLIEALQNNQNPFDVTIEAQTILQGVVLAPILPLYEAFTKKSRLEKARETLAPTVEQELNKIIQEIYQKVYQEAPDSRLQILEELQKVRDELQERQQEFQNFEVQHNPGYWSESPHKIGGFQKEEIATALTYVNRLILLLKSQPN